MAHLQKVPDQGQRVDKLVLDTAAFIKQVQVQNYGKELYTIPAVIAEIRDVRAREFHANFPYEIILKEPHPAAYAAVCEFAKKTGDYSFLSATDLRLLALQYTLEKEAHGNLDHLRVEPKEPEEVSERPNSFFSPASSVGIKVGVGNWSDTDEGGWINPDNVSEYTSAFAETSAKNEEAENVKVACLTLDFAMQNVMLQMNMNLVSVEGVAIKSTHKWVLRCLSCRKIIKDMDLLYCKSCGSGVLQKLSYTVNQDGSIHYRLPCAKPSLRGTIYPIPNMKGGKNSKDIIVVPQQLPNRRRQVQRVDLDDPDNCQFLEGRNKGPQRPTVVGYGKRNPNQAKRKIGMSYLQYSYSLRLGKKNKSQGQQV